LLLGDDFFFSSSSSFSSSSMGRRVGGANAGAAVCIPVDPLRARLWSANSTTGSRVVVAGAVAGAVVAVFSDGMGDDLLEAVALLVLVAGVVVRLLRRDRTDREVRDEEGDGFDGGAVVIRTVVDPMGISSLSDRGGD
jgi:predicted benzoate:H+ symporter BenE